MNRRRTIICTECSVKTSERDVRIDDDGTWLCPHCGSASIERVAGSYDYETTEVKIKEGGGHD